MRGKLRIVLTMLILCVVGVLNTGIKVNAETYEDFEYQLINEDSEVEIIRYNGNATEVSIPNEIDSKPVTMIGDDAFSNHLKLTAITIPNGVTSIGNRAFSACIGLTSVTIPDSVTSIGYMAFQTCLELASVSLSNNITKIESYTFNDCKKLESITIPDNVTSIGNYTFKGYLTFF